MRLTLIDRITDLQPGQSIVAVKNLSLSEEYLRDHFPRFPIMPGVLMLESMYQTAAWLVRVTDGFAHSLVTLAQANNVGFNGFVEPGQTLEVTAELGKIEANEYRFKVRGVIGDRSVVKARLVLAATNLADANPEDAPVDEQIIRALREKFRLLYPVPAEHGQE